MASSEGQTELLTGWSCIVHQPSEDPEPSELPSTVDITAFSAGLNIEPSTNTQTEECSESGSESESGSNNSGSDGSGSCSVSDSSDSDSSSSSSSSRSSSPEFSVTSSQTNGLRLKIATVRKSCGSPAVTTAEKEKPAPKAAPPEKPAAKPCKLSSSSESGDSDSESDSNETESSDGKESAKQEKAKEPPPPPVVNKKVAKAKGKPGGTEKKAVDKKAQQKKEVSPKNVRKTRSKRKKMASLPISRSSTSSSSDSDESDADSAMLASCSLQEIRQEDLAAILPDQQECDAFGAFEEAERNSPQTGDASGSDMELPQQAVNALIQRTTESSSESESHPPPNPSSLYANSLLQQFVAQTQMINTTTGGSSVTDAQAESSQDAKQSNETEIKRKRGRPKKLTKNQKIAEKNDYCADPNVSPDSGIQNSPDHASSPDCSPRPINKSESQKRLNRNNKNTVEVKQSKHIVTSNRFDRILYGNTDRVLYPPRRKVGRPAVVKKGPGRPPKISKSDNKSSKKQPGLKENAKAESVKENGRTLVKESSKAPLVKETAKEHTRVEKRDSSKSDKSRSAAAKSSSVKENLRLHSKENGKTSSGRTKHSNAEPKDKLNGNTKEAKPTKSSHLHEICERVSKRLETVPGEKPAKESETKEREGKHKQAKCSHRAILTSKNKIDKTKSKYLMLKNAKLMHSKHKHKKHKKCKFKILKPLSAAISDPKINTEIEKLVQDFVKLCCISSSKPAKENVPEILKALKKVSKKRKTSEYGDRKKKKQSTTSAIEKGANSNEQRLPLKKRHYHLSASNNESKEETVKLDEVVEDVKIKQKIVVEETFDAKSKKSLQETETKTKHKPLAKLDEHADVKTKKPVNKFEDVIDIKTKMKTEKSEEVDVKQRRDFVNSKTTVQRDAEEMLDCKPKQKHLVGNKTAKSEKIEALKPVNKQGDSISSKISGINNNEYEIKAHIDEAIEACINKYNGDQKMKTLEIKVEAFEEEKGQKLSPNLSSPKKKGCDAIKVEATETQKNILTATTPKKRHRLEMANAALPEKLVDEIKIEPSIENVVPEMKVRKNFNSVVKKIEPPPAQITTRQKYRAEDATANSAENVAQINTRQKNRVDETTTNSNENVAQMSTRQKNRADDSNANLAESAALNTRQRNRLDDITSNLTENAVQVNTRQKNRLEDITTNTRKKNRLEDLASNLVSKINENSDVQNAPKRKKEDRATVIKYPSVKKLEADIAVIKNTEVLKKSQGKLSEVEKPAEEKLKNGLDIVSTIEKNDEERVEQEKVAALPVGVFTPSVDLESHLIKKEAIEAKVEEKPKSTVRIENRKKIKKRRAINRTGFPTVKKKKKKIAPPPVPEPVVVETKPSPCERVPKDGEEYSSFVERTEKTSPWLKKPSSNFIERAEVDEKKPPPSPIKVTNEKPAIPEEVITKEKPSDDEEDPELVNVGKWEALSECDSLPLEERIDYDFTLKRRRDSQSSDLDELTLEARLERLKKSHKIKRKRETLERKCNSENAAKKRLRDVSPASSIEPYTEKRLLREDRASASSDESRKTKKTPRWRKKYLIAGLFSDYYKEGDEAAKQKRTELAMKTSKITYHPHEHPFGLLPAPHHCGKYLRCRKIPFQLPYDLWWQHTHSQLPGRDIVPSWNYRKIRTNVYNVKNTTGACEPQACNCSSQSGCGDDCINRLVLAECPASHKCKNQKIQRHDWAPGIEKFMTEYKGWGVKTNLPIKNSDFILEYVGEVVSDQEFKERMASRYIHDTHHYCLHLDGGLVIDGHRMGGDGRFVNHSCAPNCEMQKWSVNGQFRMALFALRDIKAGEELTYDYNFSLFNPADGQECRCDSENCRGVIGGKSQRIKPALPVAPSQPGRVGRPRKNQAKKALNEGKKEITAQPVSVASSVANSINMKPISHAQRLFILEHHCFLLRNLKKVRKVRERCSSSASVPRNQAPTPTNQSTFFNNLNALRQPRNMKTRRVALVDENPELKKSVQLANVLRDIFNAVAEAKDEKNEKLCTPFMYLPSKRKLPDYYTKVADPIDFTTIEQNIDSGVYKTVESFDADMNKLFDNNIKFYGRSTETGICSVRLKKVYNEVKKESMPKFENVLGIKPPAKFISNKKKGEEEDIIRCICGMYRDEGLMIQCERCLVWQHCECVRADENAPSYHCENCVPRKVDYEISLDEYTEHGHQYYMTLLRGDLQLRQGDTVYVLRDIPIPGSDKKHTYDTIGEIKYTDLDIFRIERLWKDCKNGQRFAYGHHYLRPHETYHEPTRRFFPNEVMRVPLYEAVPVELIISHCWVMDLNTFCKGRPIGAPEDHIYICEYRVDKSARLFSKVSKSKFPICTKTYAFERFDVRLKVSRTYTPHDLDPAFVKQRGRKPQEAECTKETVPVLPVNNVPVIRTPVDQKARLNTILLKLLNKLPTKQVMDVSYLLEGGRRRKKQT